MLNLSPEKNRTIPSLNYEVYYQLLKDFPHLHFTLNGGITTIDQIKEHLNRGAHGVMIGRASYKDPWMLTQGR